MTEFHTEDRRFLKSPKPQFTEELKTPSGAVQLGSKLTEAIRDDCLNFSRRVPAFDGLILSNGMIADLRSVLIGPNDPLRSYSDAFDADLDEFVEEWASSLSEAERSKGWYFHVGAAKFLREIRSVLDPSGAAVITEYAATPDNQPALFGDHYECGIDLAQLECFANRLDFDVKLVDIEEVLGIAKDECFLTIDAFLRQDKLAHAVPLSVNLWRARKPLPVLAYTPELLQRILVDELEFDDADAAELVEALRSEFYSIHDLGFDSTNPTTWGYQCLLLKLKEPKDAAELLEARIVPLLAAVLSIDRETARRRYLGWVDSRHLATGQTSPESLIASAVYNSVRRYGMKPWKFFVRETVIDLARSQQLTPDIVRQVLLGIDTHFSDTEE